MKRPKLEVRLLSIAQDDLYDVITYIAADNPAAAESMASKIEQSLIKLTKHPKLGRIPREAELAKLGYRYLVKDDYLIFYTIEGGSILVHRIIHGARDYGAVL
jgi:plasmid stabilization system protein ParE